MNVRRAGSSVALMLCLLCTPAMGAAQVNTGPQTAADSARLQILKRIERLGRAPGADSALFVQDSLAQEALGGSRGAGMSQGDSTLSALLAMQGFGLTEYEGGEADFSAKDRVLVLHSMEGTRARVNRDGLEVQADTSITYSEADGKVKTVGASTFTPPDGDMVESQGLVYDLPKGVGSARAARTSFDQGGAKWIVRGDMPLATQDSSFMSHAIFTSCELEVPHYHFETDEIKIIGGGVMVARPVRLYFADVPVAWLPFIAQSTSQGRASGILTPTFSVNDIVRNSTGYRRRISNLGFYWAMSDYSDAILAVDWFSDNFVSLTSSVNYRFNRQFLSGNVDFRRYWRSDGATELALDTRHNWEIDERTTVRVSGRYASSTDFIRQNSFNPAEVTQSIDSEGGLNRRFGWGSLSMTANRRQYMSDDRVELTLPTASLSLSTITLFRAPDNRARLWNNMTVGGSARMSRSTVDRLQAQLFDPSKTDTENTTASVGSSLSLGRFSLRQSMDLKQSSVLDIPEAYLALGDSADPADLVTGAAARSITDQTVGWQLGLDFQQPLIGSTTLTPTLSMSGSMFQSDTSALASSFVSAPSRVSFGANLKTDLYRFYPGFGGYERIRHKLSPSFAYEWSPEVEPTDLQRQVFRSRVLQPRNGLSMTLNNTIEAKKASPDTAAADTTTEAVQGTRDEPLRQERAEIVQLLGIRTSVIQYDFVEADSLGSFLSGFQTTRLSNSISSDFLQGLSVQVDHDLFDDVKREDGSLDRSFSPHLSQVNLSFSLNNRSSIFRLFGLLGSADDQPPEDEEEPDEEEEDALASPNVDESSIIPGAGTASRRPVASRTRTAGDRSWSANLSYALQRPRSGTAAT
ncbi:MAG TPA: putative LPS assembly protein LptD, partial [Longimicrobiales bacterium]|nr:putative LPS assembly protein LptD [Longimicrobiales bacterium]